MPGCIPVVATMVWSGSLKNSTQLPLFLVSCSALNLFHLSAQISKILWIDGYHFTCSIMLCLSLYPTRQFWATWMMTDLGMPLDLNRSVKLVSIFTIGSGSCDPCGLIITLLGLYTSLHICTNKLNLKLYQDPLVLVLSLPRPSY